MTIHIGADMLRKAADTITERQKAYGPPDKNFANIARLWTGWLVSRYGQVATLALDGTDVAVMNNLQKIARLAETPDHEDSWIDVAGYAACGMQVNSAAPVEEVGFRTEPFLPVEQETTGPLVEHSLECQVYTTNECNCQHSLGKIALIHEEGCRAGWTNGLTGEHYCECGALERDRLSEQANKVEQ